MASSVGTDAERLQAIQELERAIGDKQPSLNAARAKRDAARQNEAERRKAVQAIATQTKSIDTHTHDKVGAAYLNGKNLDRGTLALGNEALRFKGWHGDIDIPLRAIQDIQLGTSSLPPRAGVPILGLLIPGQARASGTIMLTVQDDSHPVPQLAVIADLPDAASWRNSLLAQQNKLSDVAAHRANLGAQHEGATASLSEATASLNNAQAELDTIDREVKTLQQQRDRIKAQQREIDAARARAVKAEQDAAKKAASQKKR